MYFWYKSLKITSTKIHLEHQVVIKNIIPMHPERNIILQRYVLTLSSRHLFSLIAPRQPRKPVTMTTMPRVMMRLAAESDGNEGDSTAKLPWETDSHTPTPSSPHPPS